MGRIWTSLIVGGTLLACGGSARREPEAPKPPPPPLSPALAEAISADLVRCDEGVARDCNALGDKLKKAERYDEALAAYDHGCELGRRAKLDPDGECSEYGPGQLCDPEVCARCSEDKRDTPECAHWNRDVCAGPSPLCAYRTRENCLELDSARVCNEAARLLYSHLVNIHETNLDRHCDGQVQSWLGQAMAYARTACDRAEQSPVAKRTGDEEPLCYHAMTVQNRMSMCADATARREASERQIAEMRARNAQLVMQSAQQLARSANAVSAARAGYVPVTFTPGTAATPDTPQIFVNPRTGAQWTGSGLALIASRMPGGAKAPPSATSSPTAPATATAQAGAGPSTTSGVASPGTPTGSAGADGANGSPAATSTQAADCGACEGKCASLKASCAKDSLRSCYLAAACLCQCHLSGPSHCGSKPEALQRCIADNEANAKKLDDRSRAPVVESDAPPPPKPPKPAPKPPPKPVKKDNCPPGATCAEKAI